MSFFDPAYAEAASLVERHSGNAVRIAAGVIEDRLARGDVEGALYMDQVRRHADWLLTDQSND